MNEIQLNIAFNNLRELLRPKQIFNAASPTDQTELIFASTPRLKQAHHHCVLQ